MSKRKAVCDSDQIYIWGISTTTICHYIECFMGWTQSSDGSTIQYLSSLKTKIYESWLQCVKHFKHKYFKFDMSDALKKNELMYFINYYFLKNLNVSLFMRLHLETNSSLLLSSDSGSASMIASFSVKHRSHFLVPPVYGWALQAIDHLRS